MNSDGNQQEEDCIGLQFLLVNASIFHAEEEYGSHVADGRRLGLKCR
jgi:hypothetical protein